MEKQLSLIIEGKIYNSSYTKVANKFVVDTHHQDLKEIVTDHFTFRIIRGKAMYFVIHSKTEEIAKQIVDQIDQKEHLLN
jgi:hypothetical protein